MPALVTASPRGLAPEAEARVGAIVGALSMWLALVGGIVFIALTVMTVVSIAGRALSPLAPAWLGPVRGDYELVVAGSAVAVFFFLPWCQFRRGHITVDIFFARASPRTVALLSLVGNVLMTAAAALIAWRLGAGMNDKFRYFETTFILQMPVWWGYAASLIGAWAFAAVSLYTGWRSYNEWRGAGEVLFTEFGQ
jgi:TRAP-type C4-dicarboxylate transport system permease small subunit